MMYTKAQMIDAYQAGVRDQAPRIATEFAAVIRGDALRYVEAVGADAASASRIAPEASTTEQRPSPYLPPVGTPEEVLARALGSVMCRMFMAFSGGVQPETLFNAAWYWPTMEALRTAYPILGTLEDARLEEQV